MRRCSRRPVSSTVAPGARVSIQSMRRNSSVGTSTTRGAFSPFAWSDTSKTVRGVAPGLVTSCTCEVMRAENIARSSSTRTALSPLPFHRSHHVRPGSMQ